jgi:O-antigen ligase
VVSPWAFGSVDPTPRFLLIALGLGGCAIALGASLASRRLDLPDVPLWPLLALLALGFFQIVPLPAAFLHVLAPGPAETWHPGGPALRAVLGDGFRPLSLDPEATRQGLLLAAGLVGLGLLAAPTLARDGPARAAAVAVALSGSALAIYGIAARSRFGDRLYGTITVPTVAPFGPFVSKNHFAGYVAMAALLALGLCVGLAGGTRHREWTRERGAMAVVLSLVAALAMGFSLFVSQSRGGVVAMAAGTLAFGLLVATGRRGWAALVPGAVVALLLLAGLVLALPPEARDRVATTEGASFRVETWRDSLRLWTSSPWMGFGFGAFADAFTRVKSGHGTIRVEHAENDYVEVLVEGGILGLALSLLTFALPAWRIGSRLPRREPLRRGIALGALCALVALCAHSALDFNIRIPSNATLAALLAAFAAAGAGVRPAALGRAPRLALALFFALAFASVLAGGPSAFDRTASWRRVREEVQLAAEALTPEVRALRAERAATRLGQALATRPAFAEGWLLLAALSREAGEAKIAAVLAAHAAALDPSRSDLTAAARALQEP